MIFSFSFRYRMTRDCMVRRAGEADLADLAKGKQPQRAFARQPTTRSNGKKALSSKNFENGVYCIQYIHRDHLGVVCCLYRLLQ